MSKNPETRVTKRITDALTKAGAVWYKNHGSSMSVSGTPDLFVCYRGRFYAMEVKTEEGEASPAQLYQMERIRQIGGGVCGVVRSPKEALEMLKETP